MVGVVTVSHKQLNAILFLHLIKRIPLKPVAHIGTRHTVWFLIKGMYTVMKEFKIWNVIKRYQANPGIICECDLSLTSLCVVAPLVWLVYYCSLLMGHFWGFWLSDDSSQPPKLGFSTSSCPKPLCCFNLAARYLFKYGNLRMSLCRDAKANQSYYLDISRFCIFTRQMWPGTFQIQMWSSGSVWDQHELPVS